MVAGIAALMFVGQVGLTPARDGARWARLMAGGFEGDHYYDAYQKDAYIATDIVQAARYVKEHTAPNEGVFVWGNDATIRFLAERPSPTRFTHVFAQAADGPLRAAYRSELMRDLTNEPPLYIAIGSPWRPGAKEDSATWFPEFENFLEHEYVFETAIGNVNLYHHVDAEAAHAEGDTPR